jgi:hypothetical protein
MASSETPGHTLHTTALVSGRAMAINYLDISPAGELFFVSGKGGRQVDQLCQAALEAGDDSLRREVETLLGYAKGTQGLSMSRHVKFLPHNRADPSSERSLATRPGQPV